MLDDSSEWPVKTLDSPCRFVSCFVRGGGFKIGFVSLLSLIAHKITGGEFLMKGWFFRQHNLQATIIG